ncbi:hypothetical protein EIO60_00668|nr:hypothetical protein [Candidatus Pantoea persica]
MSPEALSADCCIVGGGPAGLQVVVIEKHADFLGDFRGDTIHPSTLEVMHHLGLLEKLLALPHQRAETLEAEMGGEAMLAWRCRSG